MRLRNLAPLGCLLPAGKAASDVWGRMNALRAAGVGAILDYAEVRDVTTDACPGLTELHLSLFSLTEGPECIPRRCPGVQEEDLLSACRQGPAASASTAPADKPSATAAPGAAAKASASSASVEVTAENPLGGESLVESRVNARTYTYEVRPLSLRARMHLQV
jgi:proline dehydrogenase